MNENDLIFKAVLKCQKNRHKPDLHSFSAKTKNGCVWVEAREDGIYVCDEDFDGKRTRFIGTAIAAANRLERLGIITGTISF